MLGDPRTDVINVLAVVMGQAKAQSTISDLETLIRQKAIDGVSRGRRPRRAHGRRSDHPHEAVREVSLWPRLASPTRSRTSSARG
jgi:hypothetical protein